MFNISENAANIAEISKMECCHDFYVIILVAFTTINGIPSNVWVCIFYDGYHAMSGSMSCVGCVMPGSDVNQCQRSRQSRGAQVSTINTCIMYYLHIPNIL